MNHMRASISFFILLCLWSAMRPEGLFAEETATEAQRITAIIEKVINAYGGKENIESMQCMHIKGKIEAFMLRDQGTYELISREGKNSVLKPDTSIRRNSEF